MQSFATLVGEDWDCGQQQEGVIQLERVRQAPDPPARFKAFLSLCLRWAEEPGGHSGCRLPGLYTVAFQDHLSPERTTRTLRSVELGYGRAVPKVEKASGKAERPEPPTPVEVCFLPALSVGALPTLPDRPGMTLSSWVGHFGRVEIRTPVISVRPSVSFP